MMHKAHLYVLIAIMLLLSVAVSILTTADLNSGYLCGQDIDCAELAEDPSQAYYCHPTERMCYLQEEVDAALSPGVGVAPSPELTVEETLADVQADLSTLQDTLDTTNVVSGNIQARLTNIEQELTNLRSNSGTVSQQLAVQGKAVETGLTGLQKEVNETKKEVNAVGESSRLIKYGFFVLLIAAIALTLIYYVNKKEPTTVHPQVLAYITKHIKEGKKFSFIKESLQKAGWSEEEIVRAYAATVKQNYQTYQQRRLSTTASAGSGAGIAGRGAITAPATSPIVSSRLRFPRQNQNKVIGIAIITILLLLGVFFLLSGTVGKAVFYTQEVKEDTKEIVQKVECTPPHILTPNEDACCLDANGNQVCDVTEERQASVLPSAGEGQCTDSLQCETNEHCLNGRCGSLLDIYKGSPICGKICNYYALVVSTSDGETYNVKPKRGSYSCVGALEWKIMENADHCQGEKAVVPIAIIMKQPGEILSEQVITLKRRESKEVVHPTLPPCRLTLTMDEIYELCT